MLQGSCACGRFRYEIRGELLGPVSYCHCWQCRKQSGSSFGTTAGVQTSEIRVVSGEELLTSWQSGPRIHRFFASCCGSPLYKRLDDAPEASRLRLGTLDSDPGRTVERHIFVSSKVPWLDIGDELPRTDGGVPFGGRT
jgi:hypothetical protein